MRRRWAAGSSPQYVCYSKPQALSHSLPFCKQPDSKPIKYSLFVKINKYSNDSPVSALPERCLDLALGDRKPCDSAQPQCSKRKQSQNRTKKYRKFFFLVLLLLFIFFLVLLLLLLKGQGGKLHQH